MGFNERAYEDRGWCELEDRVTREAVGRSHQPGFEEVRELLEAAPLAKVYVISDEASPALVQEVAAPQRPQEVLDAIEVATFTSGADKPVVAQMYRDYRDEIFRVLDATASSCSRRPASPTWRPAAAAGGGGGGGGGGRLRSNTLTRIDPAQAERKRQRARKWASYSRPRAHSPDRPRPVCRLCVRPARHRAFHRRATWRASGLASAAWRLRWGSCG